MPGISGSHHVLSIEHLLGELRDSDGAVLLAASGSERSEASQEEVKTREGNLKVKSARAWGKLYKRITHVDSQLPQIGVKLTRESQASRDTRHDNGDKVIEITIRRC